MSAQEVIEQIKAMPPKDWQEVVDFVRSSELVSDETGEVRKPAPNWDRIIEEVFDEHDELFRKLAQ